MEGDYTSSILITQNLAANYGWKRKKHWVKRSLLTALIILLLGILKDFKARSTI
jgi:hypothetical protein